MLLWPMQKLMVCCVINCVYHVVTMGLGFVRLKQGRQVMYAVFYARKTVSFSFVEDSYKPKFEIYLHILYCFVPLYIITSVNQI